ncbi:MAG: hypothetical protein WC375_11565 [Methanomassiliicoccales archaeon]|jgi:hypothetical protein
MTLKSHKIDEIKSAKELLRIDSRYGQVLNCKRNLLIGIIAFFFVSYLLAIISLKDGKIDSELVGFVFVASVLFMTAVLVIRKSSQTRGSTFLITEKGILLEPDIVEYWVDIKEYGWEIFKGFTRLSTTNKGEGTCLIIINKGFFQRNILRWTGHSVLALYGIFFTPEQIQEIEKIFNQYDIKNNKNITYIKFTNKENSKKTNLNYIGILQILLCVVIPTIAIIILKILGILKVDFYILLFVFGVIDTVLIILIIWQSKKNRRGNEK